MDPREQRPSTRRRALEWTRALSFGVSAEGVPPPGAPTANPGAPQSPVPAALPQPPGNASPGFLGDTAQVRWARSGSRRAASGRGVTLRGRAIAARRLPAAARSYLGTSVYFLFAYFSRKPPAESQGQPGLRSAGRFPRERRSRQPPATPRPPKAQPLLCRAPLDGTSTAQPTPGQGDAPGAADKPGTWAQKGLGWRAKFP